jgi:hypothetical protein
MPPKGEPVIEDRSFADEAANRPDFGELEKSSLGVKFFLLSPADSGICPKTQTDSGGCRCEEPKLSH